MHLLPARLVRRTDHDFQGIIHNTFHFLKPKLFSLLHVPLPLLIHVRRFPLVLIMASPPNSQQSSAGYICLSLVKYSFATVSIESVAPVPWVHVSSKNNLFAIFETAKTRRLDGTIEERPKFKVLRDPEIMVTFLIQMCWKCVSSHLLGRSRPGSTGTGSSASDNPRKGCSIAQSRSQCCDHRQGAGDRHQVSYE
jgi:hypothetical protein